VSHPRPVAILVTHAGLGQELIRTAEAILGTQGDVLALSNAGLSTEGLSDSIDRLVQALPEDVPVVILADLAAGSCGMAARRAAAQGRTLARITGVNLPMLLEFFHYRDTLPFEELLARLEMKGKAGIVTL
jgi:mannose/fructose-specific phosphotransferase system component IIA